MKKLNQFPETNKQVKLLKCQLFNFECNVEAIEIFGQELPSIDISLDTLFKKRGDEFRSQLKYLPQVSNARIKVSLYKVENNSFFNISIPKFPSFSISEYPVNMNDKYQVYNPKNFTGWMLYESNGVNFVSNKKVVLKYSNNLLLNLYKF